MLNNRVAKMTAWGVLFAAFGACLYAVVTAIPYAYVGIGISIFLVGGWAGYHFLRGRSRIVVIAALGVLCVGLVVGLRLAGRQSLVIVNQSNMPIRDLTILLPTGGNSGRSFECQNVPPNSEFQVSFHMLEHATGVVVLGHFADGSDIPSEAEASAQRTATRPAARQGERVIVVQSNGAVQVVAEP